MRLFHFTADVAFAPAEELLERVTIAPLTMPLTAGSPAQAAIFRLASGGRIVRHPASLPQILAVIEGSGTVSGGDGAEKPVAAGEAVFWERGEEHETTTTGGMTALILEAEGLEPFRRADES